MSSANGKGKGVDWKATAEMLSSISTNLPPEDEDADSYTAAEVVEALFAKTSNEMQSLYGRTAPAKQEDLRELDAIKLIYDLDEMKVAKVDDLRVNASRSAPPPPHRTIAPKFKPADDFSY